MKKMQFLIVAVCICISGWAQPAIGNAEQNTEISNQDLNKEISKLKDVIKQLQNNELQSNKVKYQKDYQIIVNGIEIIKEINQGTIEISAARSQNILYKKIIDINNPTSDALGFQLTDVINKIVQDNISVLPITGKAKGRLKGIIGNLFEGLKKTFPPLQLITSVFSSISSFSTFNSRIEHISKKTDSIIVDVTNPVTASVLTKINDQLLPYIQFYTELNKINSIFENALYQHGVEYRGYIDEVNTLKDAIEKKINLNESIGNQVNDLFDISNSSAAGFSYKDKLNNENITGLVGNCIGVYDLVDRYKKFSNDFLVIQEDFYNSNISLLQNNAKKLPYKDDSKIDQLITDMNYLKNGNPAANIVGFDASNKARLKSILTKVTVMNKMRL